MNSFTGCTFIVLFCIGYSTALSLSKNVQISSSSSSSQAAVNYTTAQKTAIVNSQHHFFSLTYRSRLLYLVLRDKINSLPKSDDNQHHSSVNVSGSCAQALRSLLNEPTLHRWSLSMLDANAPMPAGLLSNDITSLGGYDQCLGIDEQYQNHYHLSENKKEEVITKSRIQGQYCLLSLKVQAVVEGRSMSESVIQQENELQRTLQHLSDVNRRFPLVLGLCIPSFCAPEEVNYLIKRYFSSEAKTNFYQSKVEHCQSAQDFLGTTSEKSVLEVLEEHNLLIVSSILAAVAIFVLTGTLADLAAVVVVADKTRHLETNSLQKLSSQKSLRSILRCFSLIRNTAILFGVSHNQNQSVKSNIYDSKTREYKPIEHRLAFLHGIRVALVAWVVAAHSVALLPASISMPVAMIARHPVDMLQLAARNHLSSTFFNNGTLAVEAFFLISGLLLVTLSLEERNSRFLKRITFPLFVALRWLRFAPPLLGTIVFWKLASIAGSGPFFARSLLQASVQAPCSDDSWWQSFLFTNNWGNLSHTCIPPSWFLSADMQIHLLAYVLILLLRRLSEGGGKDTSPLLFHLFCGAMISLSLAIPLCLLAFTNVKTFSNVDLFARRTSNDEKEENSITSYILLYTGAHVHMGAYFYGALLGFLLMKRVKEEKKRTEEIATEKSFHPLSFFKHNLITSGTLVWWSSLAVTIAFPFLSTTNQRIISADNHLGKALLVGGLHLIWTLAFGLVLFTLARCSSSFSFSSPDSALPASVTTLRRLLSWLPFRPLSRLSFTMYLAHMLLIWFNVYASRVPFQVNSGSMTLFTLGIFAETIALSYLLFILFEAPSVNLIKLAFSSAQCGESHQQAASLQNVLVKNEKKENCKTSEKSGAQQQQLLAPHKNSNSSSSNVPNNAVCVPLPVV